MGQEIIQGDGLTELKKMRDESVDCVMTSPPYWGLRDYGVEGQLGLEPTFQEYITKLCDIFDEVKRVLKKTGTCWVNLGDTYGSGFGERGQGEDFHRPWMDEKGTSVKKKPMKGFQKSLIQIPSRFAIEMSNRGWILRNEIIWFKPNCMPSSAKDRFTVDFEKLFFFVKSKNYWFETQYEEAARDWGNAGGSFLGKTGWATAAGRNDDSRKEGTNADTSKRNMRTIWTITTRPFPEAHFAVYPEKLCETPIKAGCPKQICRKCGKPRERIEKLIGHQITQSMRIAGSNENGEYFGEEIKDYEESGAQKPSETKKRILESMSKVIEYEWSDCGCNAGWESGTVLDPFMGSGTTGVVAKKQGKNFIGIEIKEEYIHIAKERLGKIPVPLSMFKEAKK